MLLLGNKEAKFLETIEVNEGDPASIGNTAALSEQGQQIQSAIEDGAPETIPHQYSVGIGTVQRAILNDISSQDEGIVEISNTIKKAKNEVCAAFYILEVDSDAGKQFISALAESQKINPNLKIFLTINSLFFQADRVNQALHEAGISAELSVHSVLPSRGSLHSKLVIIDGITAFIGGNNVDNPEECDLTVQLDGAIVENLLLEFDSQFLKGQITQINKTEQPFSLLCSHVNNTTPTSSCFDHSPIQILSKKANLSLSPNLDSPANRGLIAAIDSARSHIKITTPNFNELNVWNKLVTAADRGIKVQLLLPRDYLNIPSFLDLAPNRSLGIMWRKLSSNQRDNIEIRWYSADAKSEHHNHSKLMIIDDCWAYVGSQNMDRQSWGYSQEVGVGIDSPDKIRSIVKLGFDEPWGKGIPLRTGPLSSMLLNPTSSLSRRLARYAIPPFAIIEKISEWFNRSNPA